MRVIKNFFSAAVGLTVMLAACSKVADLPNYGAGTAPTLSASTTTVAPVAADSNKVALTLNWSNPKYSSDSATYKYIIEIDSAGKNFAKASTKQVTGTSTTSFLAKELNSLLLSKGYAFNSPVDMDVRLISSYGNNNERLTSNTVKIRMTPYKVPPKIAVPASAKLFIVGAATQGAWSNPVPTPSQEFSRLDETTFAGIFQLNGGQSYLLLPVNGSWAAKYGGMGSNNSNNPNGDDFKPEGGDLLAPATSGWYKIVVDFQTGKFSVTPYAGTLASNLFIVGNATPGGDASGWNNPVPVPSQQFIRLNSSEFEISSIALNPGKSYLFLPVNGSWTDKYGGMGGNNSNNVNGDEFKLGGSDMLAPAVPGNYKINVNFAKGTASGSSGRFTLTKL